MTHLRNGMTQCTEVILLPRGTTHKRQMTRLLALMTLSEGEDTKTKFKAVRAALNHFKPEALRP